MILKPLGWEIQHRIGSILHKAFYALPSILHSPNEMIIAESHDGCRIEWTILSEQNGQHWRADGSRKKASHGSRTFMLLHKNIVVQTELILLSFSQCLVFPVKKLLSLKIEPFSKTATKPLHRWTVRWGYLLECSHGDSLITFFFASLYLTAFPY